MVCTLISVGVATPDNTHEDPSNALVGKEKTKGKKSSIEKEKSKFSKEASLANVAWIEGLRDRGLQDLPSLCRQTKHLSRAARNIVGQLVPSRVKKPRPRALQRPLERNLNGRILNFQQKMHSFLSITSIKMKRDLEAAKKTCKEKQESLVVALHSHDDLMAEFRDLRMEIFYESYLHNPGGNFSYVESLNCEGMIARGRELCEAKVA
uniref:Uncharacterized protein n=1 Tax=Cannabis sativa TaxID=3483 RepID=A0A803QGN3_CANSA